MNKKILIIDDNKMNIRLLQEILEEEGYQVFHIENSLLSLKTALEINPDIILLDIMMPEMDGFQVCSAFKKNPLLKEIPIIMVTAKLEGKDVKQALELGAFDYIRKPVDETEVIARIHSAIKYRESQDQLRQLATRDSLTGAYNHRLLIELLEREIEKNNRYQKPTTFVMLDIDHFKNINDTYGHVAGDFVLIQLSQILTHSVRSSDIIGRYGGEEFGIIFSSAEEDAVYDICERIRRKIERTEFWADQTPIHITASLGIYSNTPKLAITSIQEIVKKADTALYAAKENGRNRIEKYVEEKKVTKPSTIW